MRHMKNLVVVKTGYPLTGRTQAYRTFFKYGWKVSIVDAPLNQGASIADVPIVCDLNDSDQVAEQVQQRIGEPDAILTFNDSGLVLAAQLAARFRLPHITVENATCVVNKELQRQRVMGAGIPVPDWQRVDDVQSALDFLSLHGTVVIKPADRSASAGVNRVDNERELMFAIEEAKKESHSGTILIEKFIVGSEFSVETVAFEGAQHVVAVTRKQVGPPPGFVELGHSLPADLDSEVRAGVEDVALRTATTLGLNVGCSHIEVIVSDDGPVLVEANARAAGDRIYDLVRLALGIDMYELLLRSASGESLSHRDVAPRTNETAVFRAVLNPRGKMLGVKLKGGAFDKRVFDAGFYGELGSDLMPPTTNGGRGKFAIAVGDSEGEANRVAEAALDKLEIVVE